MSMQLECDCSITLSETKRTYFNLVPRAFPLKNGWGGNHPVFKGKALGTRLDLLSGKRFTAEKLMFLRTNLKPALFFSNVGNMCRRRGL